MYVFLHLYIHMNIVTGHGLEKALERGTLFAVRYEKRIYIYQIRVNPVSSYDRRQNLKPNFAHVPERSELT